MSQYILIDENNVCVNVIEYDGETDYTPPEGQTLIAYDGDAHIGGTWDGTTVSNPNPVTKPGPKSSGKGMKKLGRA
jgi:hypothetical protein